jgi:hypothetical protein
MSVKTELLWWTVAWIAALALVVGIIGLTIH